MGAGGRGSGSKITEPQVEGLEVMRRRGWKGNSADEHRCKGFAVWWKEEELRSRAHCVIQMPEML